MNAPRPPCRWPPARFKPLLVALQQLQRKPAPGHAGAHRARHRAQRAGARARDPHADGLADRGGRSDVPRRPAQGRVSCASSSPTSSSTTRPATWIPPPPHVPAGHVAAGGQQPRAGLSTGAAATRFRPAAPSAAARRDRAHLRTPPYSTRISPSACRLRKASFTRWRDKPTRKPSSSCVMRSSSPTPGVEHRVEQRCQAAADARIGVVQAVDLARRDELAEPLVELVHHETVERDAAIQQRVEGVDRQARRGAAGAGPRCCSG